MDKTSPSSNAGALKIKVTGERSCSKFSLIESRMDRFTCCPLEYGKLCPKIGSQYVF